MVSRLMAFIAVAVVFSRVRPNPRTNHFTRQKCLTPIVLQMLTEFIRADFLCHFLKFFHFGPSFPSSCCLCLQKGFFFFVFSLIDEAVQNELILVSPVARSACSSSSWSVCLKSSSDFITPPSAEKSTSMLNSSEGCEVVKGPVYLRLRPPLIGDSVILIMSA